MYNSFLKSDSQKAFYWKVLLMFTKNRWDKWHKEGKSELMTAWPQVNLSFWKSSGNFIFEDHGSPSLCIGCWKQCWIKVRDFHIYRIFPARSSISLQIIFWQGRSCLAENSEQGRKPGAIESIKILTYLLENGFFWWCKRRLHL